MSERDLRRLGIEVITGKAGPTWAERTARLTTMLSALLGPEGATARALPEPRARPEPKLRTVRPVAQRRRGVEEAASSFVEALVTRSWDELGARLAEKVWVLWPDASLARHDRGELLAALAARSGSEVKAIAEHPRSYASSELRSVVARGLAEGLEAVLETSAAVVVTLELDSPRFTPGTITLALSAAASGWVVHNLPFPGLDAAARASAAPSRDEDEAVRNADRVVRHLLYGHEKHVRSLRNVMMDRVLTGDTPEPAEKLCERAAEGPHRLEAADLAFRGAERATFAAIEAKLGRAKADALKRGARAAWGAVWERLRTRVVVVKTSSVAELSAEGEAVVLMVGVKDRPHDPERWRIAGLWW